MRVRNVFQQCILCKKEPATSLEHMIPECIGGKLAVSILCTKCNNYLGSILINGIRQDPSIRLAVRNLRGEIPELFERVENGQEYYGRDRQGRLVKCTYKDSTFRVKARKDTDGSIWLDTCKGISDIRKILKKDGLTEKQIDEEIRSFVAQENDVEMHLSNSTKVIKRPVCDLFPSLQSSFLDDRFAVLLAYEYLSLILGNSIFNGGLDFVRAFIMEGKSSENIIIERLHGHHYGSWHKLYPEFLDEEVVINIRLFEWLCFKVHLKKVSIKGQERVYIEDLKNKKTLFADSLEEAKKNIYYTIY